MLIQLTRFKTRRLGAIGLTWMPRLQPWSRGYITLAFGLWRIGIKYGLARYSEMIPGEMEYWK